MRARLVAILLHVTLCACGGGGAGLTADVRERLASAESRAARERAPDVVAQVDEALAQAESAERAGDRDAAADHVTRARLLLDAAQAEALRIGDEQERRRLEALVADALARARRDEQAREAIGAELSRLASAGAAREEGLRALAQAEADEARPARRARVSLLEAQDLRRSAEALRARARLAAAAAEALGAGADALGPFSEALRASEQARTDPLAALAAADRANHEALRALGAARRELDGPGPDAALALAEVAGADGFDVLALPEGVAIEVEGLFAGPAVARTAGPRVRRLASLITAHPHGRVEVQAQVPSGARGAVRLAAQRAESLRRALIEAGVDAARLSASGLAPTLAADAPLERARLVFISYSTVP